MRWQTSDAQDRYVRGLYQAEAKGRAAAEDPAFAERHNPYKRFEHRKSWSMGFKARRAEIADAV